MGLFFIAIGIGVDLSLVLKQPVLILFLTLGYLVVKSLLIYTAARLFKISHRNAQTIAVNIAQGGELAFVIFGILTQVQLASPDIISLLTVVITLSMGLNPLIGMLSEAVTCRIDKNLQPPAFDEIKDESPEVIIAGFGRFGQIFGRILRAQGIPFVAIDHDADQIELVRKFGNKVYYGDVSRKDLLETAGARKAKYFILAIDDVELSLKTAEILRKDFPNLKVFARARNRGHAFDLMELNVHKIKRELLDSSVFFVSDLLVEMGFAPERARRLIEKFKVHDEIMLQEQFKIRTDDKSLISLSARATAQLADVLREDEQHSYIGVPDRTI